MQLQKTATPSAKLGVDLKECPRCLFTSDIAEIGPKQCNYCDLQDSLRAAADSTKWPGILSKIRKSGDGNQHDCLIGISGGEDSSILLTLAVTWGLRPLVIHFNNRWNRPEADNNIRVLTERLGVMFIEYFVDQHEYDQLTDAFLVAGLQDADIPNDIAMAKLMYQTARQYGIKYILNGHDFIHEGSSPVAWSYMDAKYVNSVYRSYTGHDLKNYPLYTFWDQIMSGLLGIKQVRPYHYIGYKIDRRSILNTLKSWGWKDYGGKHNENIYTAFVGNHLLPRKFEIDKRRTYLSAQIREGIITKEFAREVLAQPLGQPSHFKLDDLGERRQHIMRISDSPVGRRDSFERYNFKRWRPVLWILMKLGVFPRTAFVKYC